MGKRGGKKFNRGGNRGGGRSRDNWQENLTKGNEKLERYYNEPEFIPDEEKDEFWAALKRDLPNSFRFTGSRGHALAVQERLKNFYIPKITSIQYEGEFVEPPRPVSWYPDQLAWQMTTPKNVIRRHAPFSSFQKFLVAETEVGNISRQEVVSMIPPLVIDVRPGMTVLDMCAAPGSKSCQLMEMVHTGEEDSIRDVAQKAKEGALGPEPQGPEGLSDDGRTTGLLIANDSDYKRSHLLIHQMKRLSSPNLIVTNHDATMYPSIKLPPLPNAEGKQKPRYLKFDRILADVPCSGDGTARKNYNVWKEWNPSNALGLHLTQARILVRALQMLKVGGRVVYSTCSMNPVENESVIASAIARCGGSANVKIIDCSQELPGLKRAPGLKNWKVMDREGRIFSSWKEVEEHKEQQGIEGLFRLSEGMFPPLGEGADLPLEHCMRIYPHQQDTGGFFITVLEKTSEIRAKPEDNSTVIPRAAPVAALTAELDSRNKKETDPQAKLKSLDNIVVPDPEVQEELAKNESVAEASHKPPYSATLDASEVTESAKRDNEDLEEEVPAKRIRLEDGNEALIGDRPVHDPASAAKAEGVEAPAAPAPAPAQPSSGFPGKVKKKGGQQEDPYKYLDPNQEELGPIFDFYQLSERFPRDRFMVRNAEGVPHKTIYYTSPLARDILIQNEGSGMKFVHCGVKMFVKQDAQRENVCRWRIQTDGLKITEPWVGEARSVILTARETLRRLLIEMFPKVNDGGWKNLGEIGERVKDIPMGCSILRVEPNGQEDGLSERMVLPLWRSLHSLNLMLPKEERRAMLLRIFNDSTPLINTTQSQQDKANASGTSGVNTPVQETPAVSTANAEDVAMMHENAALGEDEQQYVESRETYTKAGDEEDRFNTTV